MNRLAIGILLALAFIIFLVIDCFEKDDDGSG
jgi:hypothetical protein